MASSISHGLVLTTAMVFSATVLYLAFSQTPHSNQPILRSCLCSEEKKKEMKRKKKRVKFAKNVMVKVVLKEEETDINDEIGEEQGKKKKKNRASSSSISSNCRNENPESRGNGMPANRMALYNGILRDRGNRVACCH
ncbi:uncharacterized protein LOC130745812 [Lotus japonicus]|uniref:Transmembrane protein n=1 Tax=Lotus japonicus TaxID=34305 RepID=I3SLF1_LOTJA|nr:uncharacterized protein LOC130745812 [Lotus japonicus]AFK41093.1 unknown [Lotus japonicus]